ncbi:MAG: hypothetical protein LBC31_05725 [Treponema sp.]|jgi:hypothetical protein|nr:hypothetical protein [Treponema sp.]
MTLSAGASEAEGAGKAAGVSKAAGAGGIVVPAGMDFMRIFTKELFKNLGF